MFLSDDGSIMLQEPMPSIRLAESTMIQPINSSPTNVAPMSSKSAEFAEQKAKLFIEAQKNTPLEAFKAKAFTLCANDANLLTSATRSRYFTEINAWRPKYDLYLKNNPGVADLPSKCQALNDLPPAPGVNATVFAPQPLLPIPAPVQNLPEPVQMVVKPIAQVAETAASVVAERDPATGKVKFKLVGIILAVVLAWWFFFKRKKRR